MTAKGNDPSQLDLKKGGVNQHNYHVHHDGQFWAMWSDGPGIEDRVGQRVKFATSADGLKWSAPQFLSPIPPNSGPDSPHYARKDKGMRWNSRGFWNRDGELLALALLSAAIIGGKSATNKTAVAVVMEDGGKGVVRQNPPIGFLGLQLRCAAEHTKGLPIMKRLHATDEEPTRKCTPLVL